MPLLNALRCYASAYDQPVILNPVRLHLSKHPQADTDSATGSLLPNPLCAMGSTYPLY